MPSGVFKRTKYHKERISKALIRAHKEKDFGFLKGQIPWVKGKSKKDFPQLGGGRKKGCIPWSKGKKFSKETRKKMSEARKGKHYPKLSKVLKGRKFTEEWKQKMNEAKSGEKSHFWQGGISFQDYCPIWTKTIKQIVRKRDKYTCQICGKKRTSCVHHIDYNKKNCSLNNLITLCRSCHSKTNGNRKKWRSYLTSIQQIYRDN